MVVDQLTRRLDTPPPETFITAPADPLQTRVPRMRMLVVDVVVVVVMETAEQ